ncbi:hypothetical protein AALP_AA4G012900 [Arabis alpina]|uniref:Uncharacterized protein n=1 Tax=Arabis alpina TaxID=50452 RepID=A0A087H0F1_ARAAL|nr:hypothetical protein AALP_AA4G012900 [Arabis alpina]
MRINLCRTRRENRNLPTDRSRTQTQRSGAYVRHAQDFPYEAEDPYWIEHDRLEQERITQHQTQQEEMAKLRAEMERAASNLRMLQSQDALHRSTDFAKSEDEFRASQKTGKPKKTNNPPQTANPHAAKKNNTSSGSAHHEGDFEEAHNYQVELESYNPCTGGQSTYDETSYCEYHRGSGHSTANCLTLGQKLASKLVARTLKGDFSLKDFEIEESSE